MMMTVSTSIVGWRAGAEDLSSSVKLELATLRTCAVRMNPARSPPHHFALLLFQAPVFRIVESAWQQRCEGP